MPSASRRAFLGTLSLGAAACAPTKRGSTRPPKGAAPLPKAIPGLVIHGGAGAINRQSMGADKVRSYEAALKAALMRGHSAIAQGKAALDVVEEVIRVLEDDPLFNAGKGAVLTADKTHELDASIMCGRTLRCGAVAGVTTVRHPITLARKVMEQTRHVLLSGPGADRFAEQMGVERVSQEYFLAPGRLEAFERAKKRQEESRAAEDGEKKGTVGVVVLDKQGDLAAGTSTGGLTYKQHGRIGDSPIVGAGTYADNRTCAVSCTGTGEEYIRHAISHELSARMRLAGESLATAANYVIHEVLQAGDGGLIAIDRLGNVALPFNTKGMFRGAANLNGRQFVEIWGEGRAPVEGDVRVVDR